MPLLPRVISQAACCSKALAQVTSRAKIALLGPLVPLSNPVRLAEELAMVDMLSGGRLIVLFLRGTPNEHQTYDTDAAATRAMTQEGIDLIVKAWTSDQPFAWDGAEYRFSTVAVWPKTVQTPHPPIFGSGNSDESVRFAAARRMGIAFSFAPPEVVRNWVKLYHAEAETAGWQPGPEHVIYRGIAYAAESDAKAFEDMGAFFGAKMAEQAQIQQKTLGGPPVVPLVLEPYFVGGPETLKGKMEALFMLGKNPRSSIRLLYKNDMDYGQTYYDEIGYDNLFALTSRKANVPIKLIKIEQQKIEYFKEWHP